MVGSEVSEEYAWKWWYECFGSGRDVVPFTTDFLPALEKKCSMFDTRSSCISIAELRIIARYCIIPTVPSSYTPSEHIGITREDFSHFIARFGPIELSLSKVVDSLYVKRELAPWFHGDMSRAAAESLLSDERYGDGAFLIRFSESRPTKFTLTYVKVHPKTAGSSAGKREIKNSLLENIGTQGYRLTDSKNRSYNSIRSFVHRSATRLKHPVPSTLSKQCNEELTRVRAIVEEQSETYTTFSAEAMDMSSPATSNTDGGLFSHASTSPAKAVVHQPEPVADDTYSGFTPESITSPFTTAKQLAPSNETHETYPIDDDYSTFSTLQLSNQRDDPSPGSFPSNNQTEDEYATFQSITSSIGAGNVETSNVPIPRIEKENGHPDKDVYGAFASNDIAQSFQSDDTDDIPDTETDLSDVSALNELNTGMELYQKKDLDGAVSHFVSAERAAKRDNDKVVEARALGNLGTVYLDRGEPQQAVECYERCLEITRSINDSKRERTILNNLVLALIECQEWQKAYTLSQVQLDTTSSERNRRKILNRMSLLRERMERARNDARNGVLVDGSLVL